jgi:hypothetical protein
MTIRRNPTGINGMQQTSQEIDTTKPNIARVYDYAFGGHNNFAVDREAMIVRSKTLPDAQFQDGARTASAFLVGGVRYLAAAGIRQFLDLGSVCRLWRTPAQWRNAMNEPYVPTFPVSRVCGTLRKRVGRPR